MLNRQIKKIIAGNWKMNLTNTEARELLALYNDVKWSREKEVILCIPFVMLTDALSVSKKVEIASENVSQFVKGAYTGEVSANMLKDLNLHYSLVGHSERRSIYHESNEIVNEKIKRLNEVNITPILCVGETLAENQAGKTHEVLRDQLLNSLKDITKSDDLVIAYEPVWAIGTGLTATKEVADEAIGYIKEVLNEMYPNNNILVLYGGSVNSKNINELMNTKHIDGVLVGGASLKFDEFIKIINYE